MYEERIATIVTRTYKRLMIVLEELGAADVHREKETAALLMTLTMQLLSANPNMETDAVNGMETFLNNVGIDSRSTTFMWRTEFYFSFIAGRNPIGPWDVNMAKASRQYNNTRAIVAYGDVIYNVEAIDNYEAELYSSQNYNWAEKVRTAMIQQIIPEIKKMSEELTNISGGNSRPSSVRRSGGCLTALLLMASPIITFLVFMFILS